MLALVVGGRERWREANGYTFVPADLPAGDLGEKPAGETLAQSVAAIARRWLGCDATLQPNDATYGPSERHAIDRLALATVDDIPTPAPLSLLHLERGIPLDEPESPESAGSPNHNGLPPFRRIVVQAYRAALVAEPQPGAETTAGILWLSPQALRVALRGVPLVELLAQPDVAWPPAPHLSLPGETFIFVPADYGERHLLRIAAKYGSQKLGLPVTMRDELR